MTEWCRLLCHQFQTGDRLETGDAKKPTGASLSPVSPLSPVGVKSLWGGGKEGVQGCFRELVVTLVTLVTLVTKLRFGFEVPSKRVSALAFISGIAAVKASFTKGQHHD